jgi:hypothetical protein
MRELAAMVREIAIRQARTIAMAEHPVWTSADKAPKLNCEPFRFFAPKAGKFR